MIKFDYHYIHSSSTENHKIYIFVIDNRRMHNNFLALHVLGEFWYIKERLETEDTNQQAKYGYASMSAFLIEKGNNFSQEIQPNELAPTRPATQTATIDK